MNYVEEVTKYLVEQGVAVRTEPPAGTKVHMFEVVSCPIPFEPGEAEALQAVAECTLQFQQEVAKRAPGAMVILAPGREAHPTAGVRQVGIRAGVVGLAGDHYFVVGPNGGGIERRAMGS